MLIVHVHLRNWQLWRMRRLVGLRGTTLIHHSLTDCIPLKAQHANTISSTAGHLTSTSLTRLHANSITANAAPLTNTSVIGREILRLYRNTWSHTVSLGDRIISPTVTFVALPLIRSFVSEDAEMPLKEGCFYSVSPCPQQILGRMGWNTHASVKGAIQIRLWFHISQKTAHH